MELTFTNGLNQIIVCIRIFELNGLNSSLVVQIPGNLIAGC